MKKSPNSSVFHVGIIRDDKKVVRQGSLEATPTALIYTEEISHSRYSWPLKQLRRFETDGDNTFIIEATGKGIYKFSTPNARQLKAIVNRNIRKSSPAIDHTQQTQISGHENISPVHWRLNTCMSTDSTGCSPTHSRSPSLVRESVFEVEQVLSDLRKLEPGTLEITNTDIIYTEGSTCRRVQWPFTYLRRYGFENDIFTIETGRRAQGGPGLYTFRTSKAVDINSLIKLLSVGDRTSNTSLPPSPTEVSVQNTNPSVPVYPSPLASLPPLPSTPPVSRTPIHQTPFPPPSQPPLPLPPHTAHSFLTSHTPRFSQPPFSPQHITSKLSRSPPIIRKSDSLIRRAFSALDLRQNVFEVRNISDDKKEVSQGTLEVTGTDLIYIDSRTNEKWKWPFKYLRKYGFEGSIFSFEAGRRCPGGQGLYAFATERANEIHETIAENIRGCTNANPPKRNSHLSLTNDGKPLNRNEDISDTSRNQPTTHFVSGERAKASVKPRPLQPMTTPMVTSIAPPTPTHTIVDAQSVKSTNLEDAANSPSSASSASSTHSDGPAHYAAVVSPSHDKSNQEHSSVPGIKHQLVKLVSEPVEPVSEVNKPTREHVYDIVPEESRNTFNTDTDTVFSPKSIEVDTSHHNSNGLGQQRKLKDKRLGILNRLIGRRNGSLDSPSSSPKSKSKKKERSHKERSSSHVEDGGMSYNREDEKRTYENLREVKLKKIPYSASCDDLLSSCDYNDQSRNSPHLKQKELDIDSHSSSHVPQPDLSPPSVPVPTTAGQHSIDCDSPLFYQNIHILDPKDESSNSSKALPLLTQDTPSPEGSLTIEKLSPIYSNVKDAQTAPAMSYAELEILNEPSKNIKGGKPSSLPSISPSHVQSTNNSDRDGSIPLMPDNGNEPVHYAPLDFEIMSAVAKIKREHEDVSNFEGLLERHDIREMEMRGKVI